MSQNEVIARFNNVSFEYGHNKPILQEADFSIRRGAKIALMGQNGAGKSTIFKLIIKASQLFKSEDSSESERLESGAINIDDKMIVATARQVILRNQMNLTVREFFEKCFSEKIYNIDPRIDAVCKVVNLNAPHERIVKSFSGGQQARLLLASALIQDPDLLLLDEPTNNLDKAGIEHLTKFLLDYKKTCVVISHDADFLNTFTQGVLYLDIFTRKVEQYVGNYFDVVEEIKARLERERTKNARLERDIVHRKEQANFFAQKGGHMRDVALKMKEKIEKLKKEAVDERQEDKTIRNFFIPCQEDITGQVLKLESVSIIKNHPSTKLGASKFITKKVNVILKKGERLLLAGSNGIGKTTLLEKLAHGDLKGEQITPGIRVGYYRQDFSTLNFENTVYDSLISAIKDNFDMSMTQQKLRSIAVGFLINEHLLRMKVGNLSEGQKGLVAFACLVLQKPGLLILDEPTNHINFRHIPVIASALNKYTGAMILVSHVPEFVKQIRIDTILDLEKV
ncbi:MAG: ABC transporter, ATP-binding protein [Parcubacteria group bacterium Athens1014_26]|nr:MAG: ABC transporter, ATP-binding protein [Parcubacteria group bacterium Athens1014_26]